MRTSPPEIPARGVRLVSLLLLAGLVPASAGASNLSVPEGYNLVADLMGGDRDIRRQAAARLKQAGDETLVPALVDAIFFTSGRSRNEVLDVLQALTGENHGSRYLDWVEYVGSRTDLEPKERYIEWKRMLLSRIDPEYAKILYPGAPSRIRLEEIVWGGVRLDGIPSLDRPAHIPGGEAAFMHDDEWVFGVSLGGEQRAYPRRVLSWHEMLNDVVGGEPVTLSYCTLCGSAILYSTRTPVGGARSFGTSGLLYRSNKLMFDRVSYSLWSNLTGEPVVGRLAGGAIQLEALPMTLISWEEWRSRHPDTLVLDLDALERDYGRRFGFDYRVGAADRARRGVSFPVWLESDRLERDTEIYALRLAGAVKAYPIERVRQVGVVNDRLGGESIALVADRESGAVRAFRRDELRLRHSVEAEVLVDQNGRRWRVEESFLRPVDPLPAVDPLERLPGHRAFWFGWYAFFPQTEVYEESPASNAVN